MASEIAVDVTLPFLSVTGRVGECDTFLAGHVTLAMGSRPRIMVRWKGAIYNLTGEIRENGTAIFCFLGPPDRTVEWWITAGSGLLYPHRDYTDGLGIASCRYESGNFSGTLTIEVRYGR